ncbi:protease complex subunit PrcB family protein [uncultured Kordia sp.]|uniref:protease complex subunit PrcB family protein n=1 Tax=uncultured Kordia sp. TaxID=507699 RepID=UPI002624933A|nr:protease complex subunit PrcB family protein [uncultured Kordia sp.]
MKKYLMLFVFSLFLMNCNSDDSETISTTIETTLIGKGNLHGGSSQGVTQQNHLINDEADWNAILPIFDTVSHSFTETNIDFSMFTVIVAIDQVRPNGGHELDIAINSNSENVIVTVTDISPQGQATTVITQPYHIVKIPKNTLPVIFQ